MDHALRRQDTQRNSLNLGVRHARGLTLCVQLLLGRSAVYYCFCEHTVTSYIGVAGAFGATIVYPIDLGQCHIRLYEEL